MTTLAHGKYTTVIWKKFLKVYTHYHFYKKSLLKIQQFFHMLKELSEHLGDNGPTGW